MYVFAHRLSQLYLIPRPTDQSPPKRDLKVSDPTVKGLSLSELLLAPASVLLLRFEDDNLNRTFPIFDSGQIHSWMMVSLDANITAPLLPQVLAQAIDLPIPPDPERPSGQSSPAAQPSGASKLLSRGEKKNPKWFKLGSE